MITLLPTEETSISIYVTEKLQYTINVTEKLQYMISFHFIISHPYVAFYLKQYEHFFFLRVLYFAAKTC